MKVSKNFLNDYVDIKNIDYKELADKLVTIGNEYDEAYKLINATNLVIGEIIKCEMHPESKKLHICTVNIGKEELQIVCGAPNVRKGLKVIVAKVGAKLPGGEIKKARLAGYESNGMICALNELGIEKKYLKEEDYEGICELGNDAKIGEDPLKYLELDDYVIDFDFTSNRGDMLSMLGIAYEVGAAYNLEVKYPENTPKEIQTDDKYEIDIKTDKCMAYLGRLVKDIKIEESPNFIKNRLIASGIRPINNVVDISNYVMLEYGTPLHFFDADLLGNKIIIRDAKEGEKITTLDSKERILSKEDIVIATPEKAVCLAGVMGGLETEVTENTKNIFIECAIFNPVSIRLTSKKILRNESSSRYEKGIDPNRINNAINRAAYLLEKYASGKVIKGIFGTDNTDKKDKKITVTLDKINAVLGMNLTKEDVINTLSRLKFKVSEKEGLFTVLVPTRRLDVNIKEDIIEEVGRIYGYDKIKGILPVITEKAGSRSNKHNLIREIRKNLMAHGLDEVITYSLLKKEDVDKFTYEKHGNVEIKNPISEDRTVMRKTLISSLLSVYNYNYTHNNLDVAIFEKGKTYYLDEDFLEEDKIAGLISGNYINNWQVNIKTDFYILKGIIEDLLKYLGFNNRYDFQKAKINDLHPGRSAYITIDGKTVGVLGQIHPKYAKEVYTFEISVAKLMEFKVKDIKAHEISKYPSVIKDVAFVINKDITSKEIEKIIKKAGGRDLTTIKVFDVYTGDKIKDDEKSIAYSLTFENTNKTLTEEEVNKSFENIIDTVIKTFNAKLRK